MGRRLLALDQKSSESQVPRLPALTCCSCLASSSSKENSVSFEVLVAPIFALSAARASSAPWSASRSSNFEARSSPLKPSASSADASASASICSIFSAMRPKVSNAEVSLSPDMVSWMVCWASARFLRAISRFSLRLASSILLLSWRSEPRSLSAAAFCPSHCFWYSADSSPCSCLRDRASLARSSRPARTASIAFFSHSAALRASESYCFLRRFSSAMATATCFFALINCSFISTINWLRIFSGSSALLITSLIFALRSVPILAKMLIYLSLIARAQIRCILRAIHELWMCARPRNTAAMGLRHTNNWPSSLRLEVSILSGRKGAQLLVMLANGQPDGVHRRLEFIIVQVLALQRVDDHDRVFFQTKRAGHQAGRVELKEAGKKLESPLLGGFHQFHPKGQHRLIVYKHNIVDEIGIIVDQPDSLSNLLKRIFALDKVGYNIVIRHHYLQTCGSTRSHGSHYLLHDTRSLY